MSDAMTTDERERERRERALEWFDSGAVGNDGDENFAELHAAPDRGGGRLVGFCAGHRSRDAELDALRAENERLRTGIERFLGASAKYLIVDDSELGSARDKLRRLFHEGSAALAEGEHV